MAERKKYRLSDVMDIIGGGTPKTTESSYWNGEIPWLSVVDFNTGNKYVTKTEKTITERGLSESSTKMLNEGDIIISARGTVGALAVLKKPMSFNQSCYGLRANSIIKNNDFLYYLVKDSITEINSHTYGAVFDTITKQTFQNIEISLPPLHEQQAIAEVLSSLDDKIDLLNRNNKTLEQLAETLFRQWFVEEAKEDWEEKPLDQLGEFLNGLALQKFPYSGTGEYLNVIKIKEMNGGISENTDKCNAEIPPKYVVNDGDILFSWSGSLELMFWSGGKGALNQHLFKVTSDTYPDWLLYFAILHHLQFFRDVAQDKATTMGHIQRKHLTQATIKIPDEVSLEKMNIILTPLIDKLKHNQKNIKQLQSLRDTLLPKLMSGEIRVNLNT
jgi:type I restriction enzyme S subunit